MNHDILHNLTPGRLLALGGLAGTLLLTALGVVGRNQMGDAAGRLGESFPHTTSTCVYGVNVVSSRDLRSGNLIVQFAQVQQMPHWNQSIRPAPNLHGKLRLVQVDQGCQPVDGPADGSGLVALSFEGTDAQGHDAIETEVFKVDPSYTNVAAVADSVSPVADGRDQAVDGKWTLDQDARHATFTLTGANGNVLNTVVAPIGDTTPPAPAG